jgi:hypothetical protein
MYAEVDLSNFSKPQSCHTIFVHTFWKARY